MINQTIMTAESIYQPSEMARATQVLKDLPIEVLIPKFSDWAAENRIIPIGVSDYPGPFDPEIAPHLMEILDRLHPDDPCTHVYLMANAQSGKTVSVLENIIGAVIRYKLGSILFVTSTKTITKIRGSFNIDTLIDYSGLAQYIKPLSDRTGRKKGDTSLYKEFSGGTKMLSTSYGSIADAKSNTFHYILEDELDEAGKELKDQGDTEGILEGRTKGVRQFKIFGTSTPTRMETSRIYRNFLRGDQNKLFLPCPYCGEKQHLELKMSGQDYGLTFTRETHKATNQKILIPDSIRYICQFCKEPIFESKKPWMLKNYEWIPQNRPSDDKIKTYYSPGLASPEIFLSWDRICRDFINADFGKDLAKFKDFMINDIGMPWANIKKAMQWETLKSRAEQYALGDVPVGEPRNISGIELYTGPMLLYAGVDTHKDRLEMCVTGFGINSEKWIVDYQIFYGDTSNIDDPCWTALDGWVYTHKYITLGKDLYIEMCAIDAGYNPGADKRDKDFAGKTHVVYDFVAPRIDNFMAVIGVTNEKAMGILKPSKVHDVQTDLNKRYLVSVSLLKEMIMNVITNTEGHGTIHVPQFATVEGIVKEVPDEFYKQFLSERYQEDPKAPGKWIWAKIRNRNEVLDTFIYSIAAADAHGITRWTHETWGEYYAEIMAS